MLAAVIVTFNRKELLGENIRMLLKQTRLFDKIFVVDNCSTDGTPEYLKDRGWMADPRFVYVKTHANIGGAGGFYTGTKTAHEAGTDYIHPRPETKERTVLGRKVPFFVEAPWKEYYAARNFTYMYKRSGWYKAIAFELVFVKLLAILTMKCKNTSPSKCSQRA